jgi:NitT/TauT family transport system permease protein
MLPESRTSESWRSRFLFLLPILSLIILWQMVFQAGVIRVMPSPLQVLRTLLSLISRTDGPWPLLVVHVGSSLLRIGAGFGLAMVLGVSVGLLMGMNRYIGFFLRPIFSLLLPLPTLAWVPILLIIFGIGDLTVIIAIFLGGFFSIAYNTASGVRAIDRDLVRAARTMGASPWELFSKVLFPGSMVAVLAGLRLAIGYSWRALVGAEMLAAAGRGVGALIFSARQFSDVATMFAGLVLIMAAGFLMEKLIAEPLEARTVRRWGVIEE